MTTGPSFKVIVSVFSESRDLASVITSGSMSSAYAKYFIMWSGVIRLLKKKELLPSIQSRSIQKLK
jgi:hypothetical protein